MNFSKLMDFLFKKEAETISHLFMHCSIIVQFGEAHLFLARVLIVIPIPLVSIVLYILFFFFFFAITSFVVLIKIKRFCGAIKVGDLVWHLEAARTRLSFILLICF